VLHVQHEKIETQIGHHFGAGEAGKTAPGSEKTAAFAQLSMKAGCHVREMEFLSVLEAAAG
jgi:hypothetical protein